MEFRIRNAAGALVTVFSPLAVAQVSPAVKASAVADCASCPSDPQLVHVPPDPYMIAAVAVVAVVAFALGLAVGWYASTKGLGGRRER